MNEQLLQRKLDRYNILQISLAVGWALLAIVLWFVSWWIWRGLIAVVMWNFELHRIAQYSYWGAWICTLILAIDGLRSSARCLI
jgi:hypothetical protein